MTGTTTTVTNNQTNYNSATYGADVPFITYEVNQGTLSKGAVIQNTSTAKASTAQEASNQSYVDLSSKASVSFTAQADANAMTIRYTVPDGETGKIDIQVNGVTVQSLDLSSKSSWQYLTGDHASDNPADGTAHFQFDEVSKLLQNTNIKSGDVVTIINTSANNTAVGIDIVDLEQAPSKIERPENSISLGDEKYVKMANEAGGSYSKALEEAIGDAIKDGKSVYIPEGTFNFDRYVDISAPKGVTITGAGQWYTKLFFTSNEHAYPTDNGLYTGSGGIMFKDASHVDFSNVTLDSNLTWREKLLEDGTWQRADYKGIAGTLGEGSKIHDVTITHFEAGMIIGDYTNVGADMHYTNNLEVSNVRVHNNLADGINFTQGTSNSTVINSSIRGNGDDGLATWSSIADAKGIFKGSDAKVAENNHFLNNTVELGWRAAGIGIFGGVGHEVANNLVHDNAEWSGIRVNTVFNGHNFDLNDNGISIRNNMLVNNGTEANHYNRTKGAVDFEEEKGLIKNVLLENNIILNDLSSQDISLLTLADRANNILDPHEFPESGYSSITIKDNVIDNNATSAATYTTLNGTSGNDTIYGTDGVDKIYSLGGSDTIYANRGDDRIYLTGNQSNFASGGDGNDQILGGYGNDTINGDSGNDFIYGNTGNDSLNGGSGDDALYGGDGNDTLLGESGNDLLYGGSGNDLIFSGAGDDLLFGGSDADTYVYIRGDEHDTIIDSANDSNAIQFGQGIAVSDLSLVTSANSAKGTDWTLSIKGNDNDQISIYNQYAAGSDSAVIKEFRFDEGTFDVNTLLNKLQDAGSVSGIL